jgi:hypothetical protein
LHCYLYKLSDAQRALSAVFALAATGLAILTTTPALAEFQIQEAGV